MPYPDDDLPTAESLLTGGSCPTCGQPIGEPLGEIVHD